MAFNCLPLLELANVFVQKRLAKHAEVGLAPELQRWIAAGRELGGGERLGGALGGVREGAVLYFVRRLRVDALF